MTNERGAWGQEIANKTTKWKLDKTETLSRMRLKLKMNYDFDDHSSAISTKSLSESESIALEKSQETTPILFAGLKPTSKEKEKDEEEVDIVDGEASVNPNSKP